MPMEEKNILIDIHIPLVDHVDAGFGNAVELGTEPLKKSYMHALKREIDASLADLEGYRVCCARVSGGSPTAQDLPVIGILIAYLREHLQFVEDCEISIEAIPPQILRALETGLWPGEFNRLEMYARSAEPIELADMYTPTTWERTSEAAKRLHEAGFESFGMIFNYGLPGQTLQRLQYTLSRIPTCLPQSLRIIPYPGPSTAWKQSLYAAFVEALIRQGYRRLSLREFARGMFYGRYTQAWLSGMEYIGFGLNAASHLDGYAYRNTASMPRYLKGAGDMAATAIKVQALDLEDEMSLFYDLALQRAEGMDRSAFFSRFGLPLPAALESRIDALKAAGRAIEKANVVKLTDEGFLSLS